MLPATTDSYFCVDRVAGDIQYVGASVDCKKTQILGVVPHHTVFGPGQGGVATGYGSLQTVSAEIPAGAFPNGGTVDIEAALNPDSDAPSGAIGSVFSIEASAEPQDAVTLKVPYPAGASEKPADVTLAWWSSFTNSWHPVPTTYDAGQGLLVATAGHFSIWGWIVKRIIEPLWGPVAPNPPVCSTPPPSWATVNEVSAGAFSVAMSCAGGAANGDFEVRVRPAGDHAIEVRFSRPPASLTTTGDFKEVGVIGGAQDGLYTAIVPPGSILSATFTRPDVTVSATRFPLYGYALRDGTTYIIDAGLRLVDTAADIATGDKTTFKNFIIDAAVNCLGDLSSLDAAISVDCVVNQAVGTAETVGIDKARVAIFKKALTNVFLKAVFLDDVFKATKDATLAFLNSNAKPTIIDAVLTGKSGGSDGGGTVTPVWSMPTSAQPIPTPTPTGDVISALCPLDNSTTAPLGLVSPDGTALWSEPNALRQCGGAEAVTDASGVTYVTVYGTGATVAVEARNRQGTVLWSTPYSGSAGQPALGWNGDVYFASGGTLIGLNMKTGAVDLEDSAFTYITGLATYKDGIVVEDDGQTLDYLNYDGSLAAAYSEGLVFSDPSDDFVTGGGGRVFVVGELAPLGICSVEEFTPSGRAWSSTVSDVCFPGGLDALNREDRLMPTPDGGVVFTSGAVTEEVSGGGEIDHPALAQSFDAAGAPRWIHQIEVPPGAGGWGLSAPEDVDQNGVVVLPTVYTDSSGIDRTQIEFLDQATGKSRFPTLDFNGKGSAINNDSNVAIDNDRVYVGLDTTLTGGGYSLSAFSVPGLGRDYRVAVSTPTLGFQ